MMLGARTGAWAQSVGGGEWKNPYITDGLVAMWDGEWNVGGGKHDASAEVWKDLAGNIDLTVLHTPIWGDRFCTMQGPGNGWVSDRDFDSVIPNMLAGSGGAIEVVTGAIAGSSHNRIVTSFKDNICCIRQNCSDATRVGFSIYFNGENVGITYGNRPLKSSATAVSNAGVWTIIHHAGGVDYSDSRGSATYPVSNAIKVAVGLRQNNVNDGYYVGDIYCVRYYDRALTSQEIASNYAVDKARFNLP